MKVKELLNVLNDLIVKNNQNAEMNVLVWKDDGEEILPVHEWFLSNKNHEEWNISPSIFLKVQIEDEL